MASLPTSYLDDTVFEFPNHPFNLGDMPYDDTFQFGYSSNSNDSSVAVQIPSTNICMEPPVTPLNTAEAIIRPRVEFVAKRLAAIPRRFASQAQTMFIHRMHFQYTCPTALQDAMSACALYSIKNEANQALVFGHVQQKCQQLVTSTDAHSASKTELLAALQALVLYQMIRLFDGDIRLRALAEADESVTLQWANRLKTLLRDGGAVMRHSAASSPITRVGFHPSSSSPSSPRDIPVDSSDNWLYWLTTESIRRTIITTHVLSGIYNFLKLGYDGPTPDLHVSFTAQTALWGAQSESGWRWAREDANVENLEIWVERWDEAIMKARPEDLEDMGVYIMVMLWGVEGARVWLGREFVARFGLDGM
ncbi:hypothetical protein AA0119_g11912 [Alternaria tenuissima]|uniref:Transcription factor domain-containing protein n=1 Tax=Alternaria tenuissima TaxID=119927 RepID=A0ABY0FSV5_9PLEO|nr:hypothetical protein AA0119_g11912 [Alternaria tenuissima]RYO05259.1 hypothetical protein AA0121_g12556 [Alternaria tenuissima]